MLLFSVYNKLKLKKWDKLSSTKRFTIVQKIAKKEAKILGLKPIGLSLRNDYDWDCFGMFEKKNGQETLVLNSKLINVSSLRFHALETIIHETRHAYQHRIISVSTLHWWNFKKKQWAKNYSSYITSAEDSSFYNLQPIERDAQKYTISRLRRFRFRYRKEKEFFNTLTKIIERYDTSEKKARKAHGFFYKFKLRKSLNKKEDSEK